MEFTFSWGETDKKEIYYKRYRWPDGNDKCYEETKYQIKGVESDNFC